MPRNSSAVFVLVVVALNVLANPSRVEAGFILLSDQSQLFSNDGFDWGQLGPPNTMLTPPLSLISDGGAPFVLTHLNEPGGDPILVHMLLTDPFVPGSLTAIDRRSDILRPEILIDFDQPVRQFGFDLKADLRGPSVSYTSITLQALTESGSVLASFLLQENFSGGLVFEGFVGIRSDIADIDTVRILAQDMDINFTTGRQDTAITLGQLYFENSAAMATVPEPSSLLIQILFLASAAIAVSFRRDAAQFAEGAAIARNRCRRSDVFSSARYVSHRRTREKSLSI